MNKTGDEIELDVFNIITNSQLAKEIKGNVYREGTRDLNPMGSTPCMRLSPHTAFHHNFKFYLYLESAFNKF